MNKRKWFLTQATPSRAEDLNFQPDALMVMNPTPYSCLLREGNLNTPTYDSYDYIIPPGLNMTLPLTSPFFAAALDIRTGAASAVFSMPCVLMFMSGGIVPEFGESSYRQTQRIDHSVTAPAFSSDIYDCRAARGMLLSIRNKSGYVFNSAHCVAGVVEILTANSPDEFSTGAEKLTRTIPLPLSALSVEAVIPLAASFVEIRIHNYYAVVDPLDVQIDVALLDSIPSFRPRTITEYVRQQWTVGAVGTYEIMQEHVQAALPFMDVVIFPSTPSANFDIELLINQIEGISSTGEAFRISRDGGITGVTGYQRQPCHFLGRDPATGNMQYRLPLTARVDRYVRILMIVHTTPAEVHVRIPFEMEI